MCHYVQVSKWEDFEPQSNTPTARLMSLLKRKRHFHRLHYKLDDWLREECATDKGAEKQRVRLNGRESSMFSQHIMDLVACMLPAAQDLPQHLSYVHALVYIGLKFSDGIVVLSIYQITIAQVKDMKSRCQIYFNAWKVLLDRQVMRTNVEC